MQYLKKQYRVIATIFLASIMLSGCVTMPEFDMSFITEGLAIGGNEPEIEARTDDINNIEEIGEVITDEETPEILPPENTNNSRAAPVVNRIRQRAGVLPNTPREAAITPTISEPELEPIDDIEMELLVSETLARARQASAAIDAPRPIETQRPEPEEQVTAAPNTNPIPVPIPSRTIIPPTQVPTPAPTNNIPEQIASIPSNIETIEDVPSSISGLPVPPNFPGERLSSIEKSDLLEEANRSIEGEDYYDALDILMPLAEGYAYPPAITLLASLYMEGNGVSKSPSRAISYYRRAAEAGDNNAKAQLGYFYETGEHVEQDYSTAREFYQSAANDNNIMALEGLGRLYEGGLGVTRSETEAAEFFARAARQSRNNNRDSAHQRLRR